MTDKTRDSDLPHSAELTDEQKRNKEQLEAARHAGGNTIDPAK